MEKEMRKKTGNQQKDNKDNKTIKRKEMEAKARKGKAHRCERTKGPLASGGSGRAVRPGWSPVGAEFPGAHRGLSPEGYRGAGVRVYRCVRV